MGVSWTTYGIQLSCFHLLIIVLQIHRCFSLNSEGLALLEFQASVDSDPYGALANWNPNDHDPCMWSGVHCLDGKVQMLDLNGCYLEGVLAPELGNLSHLRILDLSKNQFFGIIPQQFGLLTTLEVLDLRDNNLSGIIPVELGGLHSLKRLLLCNNRFEGSIPLEFGKLGLLTDLRFDENLTADVASGCVNRKLGHCIWQSGLKALRKPGSFFIPIKGTLTSYLNLFPLFKFGGELLNNHVSVCCSNLPSPPEPSVIQNVEGLVINARRRLVEQLSNLAAAPANVRSPSEHVNSLPSTRSSGSFPAVPNRKKLNPLPASLPSSPPQQSHNMTYPAGNSYGTVNQPTDKQSSTGGKSGNSWKYIVGISSGIFLLIVAAAMFIICRSRAARTITPWKTGLSGQLQKAFITGVPKLNRTELETACEDFSNIISTYDDVATVFKGTLSSGVEIAVVSTTITSLKDWSKRSELAYRKKIDILSRVNHKNYVNLIGYCEEDEPFIRMMVFEYAPNGTLFEHLHVKEVEHLDWNARMRIIMGTAYCLQYMHDLNPPVAHSNLTSKDIFLTDDYAAKIAELGFWAELVAKSKNPGETDSEHSELPPLADLDTNVYSFGILLLEIISGKVPSTKEHGHIINWAAEYLNDKSSVTSLIDPTLKSFKSNELDIICEVIRGCIQQDTRKRPSVKEIIQKLREVIDISPDAATPRLSPLWWAELEILSAEAA
ncbi:Leucine-rich repeat protein kinase family protein [Abeliophyllum distichum]|uniref:Leucine-rich repeat protein kinase family protein n=1 Tax=Abeliophyllum distichum TaxID=126358 RepID=A0ABD1UGV3_9LAMI